MESKLFEKVIEETEKLGIVAKAWDELFSALDDYAILLEDVVFSNNPQKTVRESLEKDKFQYCISRIDENTDTIIKCLGFDPSAQVNPTFFQRLLTLFSKRIRAEKRELNNILSTENLIRLSGKIGNIINLFNNMDKNESSHLSIYREALHSSLDKFRVYLTAYNKLNPRKEISGVLEAIKKWNKLPAGEQKSIIDDWEQKEIPAWKRDN